MEMHQTKVQNMFVVINRCFMFVHSIAISLLIHYRASFLFFQNTKTTLPWILVSASEILLSFIWLLGQAYRWKPVTRKAFPDRLPQNDDALPAIDVFICTADPNREPTFGVMNTVLSVMAMDYPIGKLNVYLSDDSGSEITLMGLREAWKFGKWWVPFCRKHQIKTVCPETYFSNCEEDEDDEDDESLRDKKLIKEKFELFKERVERIRADWSLKKKRTNSSTDHPALVEIIQENTEVMEMPMVVYVAREKRPSRRHNFKAGALNVLFRVSGIMTNSPYVLVLDCDMFSNDTSSAKQAMCFHLDPNISSSLSFVEFPQRFHNISRNDIYDSQIRAIFEVLWMGMDGLRGPCIPGTNFYIKRKSLYVPSFNKGIDLAEAANNFGPSDKFLRSLDHPQPLDHENVRDSSPGLLQEAHFVASSTYECQTQWGIKVGFLYHSVLEDAFTSFNLHCRGWTSVYLNPTRPQFLGASTTNLSEVLTQGTRWSSGLTEIALSRFCPLIYGPLRMSLLESMCYADLAFQPLLYSLSLWCFATIPQICLVNGIPLYPQVSSPYFKVYTFVYISSLSKHLFEVLMTGGSVQNFWNEHRIWMIKSVTCHFYGTLDALMKLLKLREASFIPTNKAADDNEQIARYRNDVFDFQAPTLLVAPLATLIAVNLAAFAVGIVRAISKGDLEKMFMQVFITAHILVMNYAVLEGMVLRKDKGRIKTRVSVMSLGLALVFLVVGSVFLMV